MTITFTTKEEYLAWRAEWRRHYAELSREIRAYKLAVRALTSGLERPRWDASRAQVEETVKKHINPSGCFESWKLNRYREKATEMLALRKQAKILAQELYLQRKAALQTA